MKLYKGIVILLLFISCSNDKKEQVMIFTGTTGAEVEYLILGKDTIQVTNGIFSDTLNVIENKFENIKLSTWDWPELIYVEAGNKFSADFSNDKVLVQEDPLNNFLLNKDSILVPYSARWDMEEEQFNEAWQKEFPINLTKIDSFFKGTNVKAEHISDLKQMELMSRGHRTANFINFQERKGKSIDRNIYDFVKQIDFRNDRIVEHVSTFNFQYFYILDKVKDEIPDSIYPFVAVDTINKYAQNNTIRELIISSVIRSALFDQEIDSKKIFSLYEANVGTIKNDDPMVELFDKIQKLAPGNKAPDFGSLQNLDNETFILDDFSGQNILIAVWGSWCPFCKEELPALKELSSKYADKFVTVAISFDKEEAPWRKYVEENNWPAVHLLDPERKSDFKTNYLTKGTNKYFLINKEGNILMNSKFKPSSLELERLIQEL